MGSPNVFNLRPNGANFKPGMSGNPGGRPKMDPVLRKKLREWSPEIAERIRKICLESESEFASIAAGRLILAYAWGNPESSMEVYNDPRDLPDQPPLTVEERRAVARMKLSDEQPPDDGEPEP